MPQPPLNLDEIEARAARLYERTATIDPNAHPDFGQLTDADVPAMAAEISRLRTRVAELEEERRLEWLSQGATLHTPRLCACGHSHHAHTVPAPHSCFAHGQTCPCEAYQQLPHDEAVAQLKRNQQAAADRAAAEETHVVADDSSSAPDPLAYGPTGIPCGCGKDAHSSLVPCQPDAETLIGSITIRSESIQLDNGECLRDLAIGDSVELRADTSHEGLWIAAAFHGDHQDRITLQYAEVVEDCGNDPAIACEFSGTRHAHPVDLDGKVRPRPTP